MNSQNAKNSDFNVEKPHIFDPSAEVKGILELPSDERKLALENFYKNLEKYHADLVGVFDYARAEFGDLDLSNKTDEEIDAEIEKFLQKFGEKIENFDEKTKSKILEWIAKYTENKKNAYKKLKEFEENPLKFLQENGFEGESLDEIQGKIEVDEYRGNVVIYLDEVDRKNFGLDMARGVFSGKTWNIVVLKDVDYYNTLIHENQHAENNDFFLYDEESFVQEDIEIASDIFRLYRKNISVFDGDVIEKIDQKEIEIMSWPLLKGAILRFKDELLAQLKGGTKWEEIQKIFTHLPAYNYFSYLRVDTNIYKTLRDEYLGIIGKYIYEAEKLIKSGISLDVLAITPIEKWGRFLKNSEKLQENFVFENIENLENGNFFAKKIFENGEIWEGIFDKNKRFLEWKKIIGDEIQEWKFFQRNNSNHGINNENLSSGTRKYQGFIWENHAIGEFLPNGVSLRKGIEISEKLVTLWKNGEMYRVGFLDSWDEKENIFKADIAYGDMARVREIWEFSLKNGELFLQNGKIILKKSFIDFDSKFYEFSRKINITKLLFKLENFLPFLKVEMEIKNGEIILDSTKIREINDFLLTFKDLEFKKVLEKYGYNTNKKKNFFKQKFAEIFF